MEPEHQLKIELAQLRAYHALLNLWLLNEAIGKPMNEALFRAFEADTKVANWVNDILTSVEMGISADASAEEILPLLREATAMIRGSHLNWEFIHRQAVLLLPLPPDVR